MVRFHKVGLLLLAHCIFNVSPCLALNATTHQAINGFLSQNSLNGFSLDSYLIEEIGFEEGCKQILTSGISKKAWEWMALGGGYEDEPPSSVSYLRSANHFHEPLSNSGYAGIWGTGVLSGYSSVKWSQLPIGTQDPGGHYSWHDVRDYFNKALTGQSAATREKNFADLFRGLGQLMHLVQDLSVPEHARNDGHFFPGYEGWASGEGNISIDSESGIISVGGAPVSPIFFDPVELPKPNPLGEVPIANLFDVNQYVSSNPNPSVTLKSNIGLAEYTNANFLSPDSMFTTEFPYPRAEDCLLYHDDSVDRKYLKIAANAGGEKVNHLALVSWLYFWRIVYFPQDLLNLPVGLDASCYRDYASLLLPRAVGYSAGLLQYFFRGRIDMVQDTVAGSGYRIVNHSEEDMAGRFELYYDTTNDNRVMAYSENLNLGGVLSSNNMSKNIVFPDPRDARDPGNYILVFKGRLGNEPNAVVGKVLEAQSFYLRMTCNGLTPSRPKTIKLVDANGGEQVKTTDLEEAGKVGPFLNVTFPATLYLYHRDTPSESSQTLFTFWTRCETADPEVMHPRILEVACPITDNKYLTLRMLTGPGTLNVKEVKWKKGSTLISIPDEGAVVDFSDLKVLEEVKVHYKTWHPTLEHGCNPEPATKIVNEKSYATSVWGQFPWNCEEEYFGDVCKPGSCGTSPDGTCLFWDYKRTIGEHNATEERLVIPTDEDGNNPVFQGLDICVDAKVDVLAIGCCDGMGGPDAYIRESFVISCWEKYTFRMVESSP